MLSQSFEYVITTQRRQRELYMLLEILPVDIQVLIYRK